MSSLSLHLVTLLAAALLGGGASAPATLEEAREEIRTGRYWHAAELLLEMDRREGLEPEGQLLLAEARAGFHDWGGVRELLEGATWLDSLAPVRGPELLGRAHEAAEAWEAAAEHYALAASRMGEATFPLGARLVRAELRARGPVAAVAALGGLPERHAALVSGLAWELAREAAPEGDTATVAAFLPLIQNEGFRRRSVGLLPGAVLAAGDSTRAESLFRELLEVDAGGDADEWRYRVAALALARGDTAGARPLFRETLLSSFRSAAGQASAAALVDLGGLDRDEALQAARGTDLMGDGGRALTAYDRHVALSREAGVEADVRARVERARLMATVPSRMDEAVEEFRALDEHPDPSVGARVLEIWAALRRRQGQTGNYRTLRQWLVERYPDTDQAAEVVFLRGDNAQDARDWLNAVGHYREVAAMAPERMLAGLARMRIGQIHLQRGDPEAALAAYRDYLETFPDGRRWTEASFWAARILLEAGDTAEAASLLEPVHRGDPLSYYAAEGARLLGQPFPQISGAEPEVAEAGWVPQALERLALLEEAGLPQAAAVHVSSLVSRADAEGPSAQYPLAEGLIQAGWTVEGISRGWVLLDRGEEHNPRLIRILFPYPRREMVEREAAEYGLDPILMAALIRQESAWDRDIVSHAGAVGLMQVMPPTGEQLARAIGPRGFTRASLEAAEVNLHLGGRFLRDMLDRYGPELPLVLSAYNAGPTRARRWREYPEVVDPLRFTERIPFTETRGYVKNVTRNLALYRALYGEAAARPVSE